MNRRLRVIAIVFAACIAACSQQSTPIPSNTTSNPVPVGYMSVTFQVAGALNFSSYNYWIIFNTDGKQGDTPSTMPQFSNWAGYSYFVEVEGTAGGGSTAKAYRFLRNSNPVVPPYLEQLATTAASLQYTPSSSGKSEFTVTFSRSIFEGAKSTIWHFNAFTWLAHGREAIVDSMGPGGPNNPQYVSPALDVAQSFNRTYYATYSGAQIDPNAQIVSVRLANNP
jgi:hypothetical protein